MGSGGVFLRRLRARVMEEPTGFVWIEKGRVAASGYPASPGQLRWLEGQGIEAVLTLTEKPLPEDVVNGVQMKFHHLPMKDHGVPNLADLERGALIVQEEVSKGNTIVVHCLAGEGRTGSVLAAYLIRDRKIGAEEALRLLRDKKQEFVEWSQEKAVYDYASSLK